MTRPSATPLIGHHPNNEQPQKTVLYVEDNPASLALVEQVLHLRHDWRLLSAPDASLGIDLAMAHQPDVILMDLNLPGLDGAQALRILRANPRTAHIPVIAVTANAMPSAVNSALSAGFYRYLTKPIDVQILLSAIDAALSDATPHEAQNEAHNDLP